MFQHLVEEIGRIFLKMCNGNHLNTLVGFSTVWICWISLKGCENNH